ncbi:MAG TPA: LLM class flavin-dependent oxidoreductase [Myxococcales bacterium]|nr:LLM class flavin-dependent oxidoreductase [Myxococcales bacterium]
MVPLSVLDLAPVVEGADAARALRCSLDLAQHAERWGYRRFWLAEHHGMPGVASAATSVVIAHVAGGTSSIRVGAGGIMLPNHAPLVIAEQFGTLASLYPGRIDLGIGRAPGTDPLTAQALRRTLTGDVDDFPRDVVELMEYFQPPRPGRVLAVPGAGLDVPVWILGSSLYGASLAAALGLPFAFASHFAPAQLQRALAVYRGEFRPSSRLQQPYAMVGVTVIAAETDDRAAFLATSLEQAVVNLRTARPGKLPAPKAALGWGPMQRAILDDFLGCSAIGSPATVKRRLGEIAARTEADELILASQIFDHDARLRSYELAAQPG